MAQRRIPALPLPSSAWRPVCLAWLLALAGCAPARPTPVAPPAPAATGAPTAVPGSAPALVNGTAEPALALVNGTLIDGTGAAPVAGAVVLIRGERIVAAAPAGAVGVPAGAQVIDVAGATILPGFINAHVHGAYNAGNLAAWAQAGVTTVRDESCRGSTPAAVAAQCALRDGELARPELARLVAATPMLTAPGGYGAYPVTSPEDARRAVNELLDAGADLVKTTVEDDLQGRRWKTLSAESLKAIVEAAHARGRPVSIHVSRASHVELALEAGVDDLAHMVVTTLDDDLIDRVVAAGVYWVPTLELWQGVGWGAVPTANLRRFVTRGGQVALGTDYGGYTIPFDLGMPVREIAFMQEAGMTPMQIIVAATRNAAHVCGRDADLGTVEAGKLADLLVVDGDPLADLGALTQVRMVIKGGAVIRGPEM